MSNVLGLSDCFTQQEVSTCFLFSLDCRTHNQRTQGQPEVSLKHYSCTGRQNKICSKLAQLTLRIGHNYANSQAHSQAGSQAYRCLGWRDHGIVVVVEVRSDSKSGTTFGDNFWSESRRRYSTIRSGTNIKIISLAANYL